MVTLRVSLLAGAVATLVGVSARADTLTLTGPTINSGIYSTSQLESLAGANTVTSGGLTGISLWNLLGGVDQGNTAVVWGGITTSTPAGDNGKNAILRYYVLATGSGGARSAISLGEIEPRVGGTASNPS